MKRRKAREWWLECINPKCGDCKRSGVSRILLREVPFRQRKKVRQGVSIKQIETHMRSKLIDDRGEE